MASVAKLLFYLFLFVITIAEGKKKSMEKIVIHVPYKIHKHHHTHTKYKVITIPPKKQNTIIYLKEEAQPIIKHVPPVKIQTQVIEAEHKAPQHFIPPHQQSAAALLATLSHHKGEADQQGLSTTVQEQEQKPQESQMGDHSAELVPNIIYKPIVLQPQNLMPNFPLRPILLQPQHVLTPKIVMNSGVHPAYDAFFPKVAYQPMIHLPKKYTPKAILPPKKDVQDNEHSGSQVYKTIINPKQKTKHYKVKEESQEDVQLVKNQQTTSNSVSVPSLKSNKKGKTYFQHLKSVEDMIKSNPDYEYEHIGYLVIDGNSKKVVGKNLKDEIHLTR